MKKVDKRKARGWGLSLFTEARVQYIEKRKNKRKPKKKTSGVMT